MHILSNVYSKVRLINFFSLSLFITFLLMYHSGTAQNCPDPTGLAGEDQTICRDGTATLGCDQLSDWCYKWYPETAFPDFATTLLPTPTTLPLTEDTEFTLVLSDGNGNVVYPLLTVMVFMDDVSVDAGEHVGICDDETVTLTTTSAGANSYNYLWSTGETTQSIEVSPNETTDYTVEVEDADNGCKAKDEVRVTVKMNPVAEIIASTPTLCLPAPGRPSTAPNETGEKAVSDCSNEKVLLYAGTGLEGYTYKWSTGETEPLIEVFAPGIYSVTISEIGGCSAESSYEVGSCVALEIDVTYDQSGGSILDAGSGFESYVWHDGSTGQTINVTGPGTYSVTVASEGCSSIEEVEIKDYEYDPNNVFLVLNTYAKEGDNSQNIFICNVLGEEGYSSEDKAKIEDLIKGEVRKFGGIGTNILWDCAPAHSDEFPLDKNVVIQDPNEPQGTSIENMRFYSFLLKKNTEGNFERLGYYVNSSNQNAFYKATLNISTQNQEINLYNTRLFSTIDILALPDQVTGELSIRDAMENPQVPAVSMNITFKPTETNNRTFTLFYNETAAPDEIEMEERSYVSLQIKELVGNAYQPIDPAVDNIGWWVEAEDEEGKLKNVYQGDFINKT